MATINMQTMRYLNLLSRVSRVQTSKCFLYNNMIIFAVPGELMSQAIGPKGKNVRAMEMTLGKRIKIIRQASNIDEAARFINDVIEPISFKSIEINEEIVINAGSRNKAALIGRNKRRLIELNQIIEDNFGKQIRIV